MVTVTDEKRRAIFDEIAHILETPQQAEDEITTKEYATFGGCTRRKAYTLLMKAVVDERMTKRKVLIGCHWQWVFRMVKDEKETSGINN